MSGSEIYRQVSQPRVLHSDDMLNVAIMDKDEDLSDFDERQIVTTRKLGQSISETARLVGR